MEDRLIVALDFRSGEEAISLVRSLGDLVVFYKVGLELFLSAGESIVHKLKEAGKKVFLDLKFHDIPTQVANGCRAATRMGADMLTVHALGGEEMIRVSVESIVDEASTLGIEAPRIVAVTILTSLDDSHLRSIGLNGSAEENVLRLAGLARDAGADGVVASPREVRAIKSSVAVPGPFLIVTPGIRRAEEAADEQKRTLSPSQAIALGADFLVVGRPITKASDPAAAAEAMLEEMCGGRP